VAPPGTGHSRGMSKRAALVPALLVVGLVVAVVGATAALRLIGTGGLGPGGEPLSQADVQRALAQQPPTTPAQRTPQPTPGHRSPSGRPSPHHPAPTARPVPGSFSSAGGSVSAHCLSGRVTLTSWIPAQGYRSDGYVQGPATTAWVKFTSATSEVTVTVTCGSAGPSFSAAADNHGGGGGGGGGGHGGGGGGNGGGGSGRSPGGSGH
jgi:hypothetical protein